MRPLTTIITTLAFLSAAPITLADTAMLVPINPALSPDGSLLVFSWEGDLWSVSSDPDSGEHAKRLTIHPGNENNPIFSPDGNTIYYNSNQEGSLQVFSIPLDKSSTEKQLTFHSTNNLLEDISADGENIIYRSARDKSGRNPYRAYQSPISADQPEQILFDAYALHTKLSPDDTKILFTREGDSPYRIGYHGSQASQIWLYDIATKTYTQPVSDPYGCLAPMWLPDGSGFYYLNGKSGNFNLYKHQFSNSQDTQLTSYNDANVMFPVISKDGSTIVYRHLFHYYRLDTKTGKSAKLPLKHNLPLQTNTPINTAIKKTDDIDFSPSGLEISFTANGDIFAMDTVLREPMQLTHTAEHESNIFFGDKGRAIYYISDDGLKTTINKITKSDPSKYWWETKSLKTTTVINPEQLIIESFSPSPDGKHIGYTTSNGQFFIYDLKTKKSRLIAHSWNSPYFEWSPNSEWITYSIQNNNFNSDIYLVPTDASQEPVNVTKHPDNEFSPSFSPDGKKLTFIGKRHSTNFDLYYVELTPTGSEKSDRDKKIEQAKNLMKKDPVYNTPAAKLKSVIEKLTPAASTPDKPKDTPSSDTNTTSETPKKTKPEPESKSKAKPEPKSKHKLTYDLTNIQERIHHIPLNGLIPSQVYWKHDSSAILINSKRSKNTYAYSLKTKRPVKYLDATGSPIRYDKKGTLYWLSNNVPGIVKSGKPIKYTFSAQTEFNRTQHQRYKFRLIWRTIRDTFYDENLNGTNWDQIRTKYEEAATLAESSHTFDRIISMLLGELNASHTGYLSSTPDSWRKKVPWKEEMLHLGALYTAKNDGWHITKVLTNSPANGKLSKLEPGETITHINGTELNDKTLLKDVLWGQLKNSLLLQVRSQDGESRDLNLAPISYTAARDLVSADQISYNKTMVEKLSDAKFGYIHIASMQWDEFRKFEQHLYENGAGKDGIIIDVRDNGGGFTTDHLLTALTQPRHAYTIPRNGGLGYPQDRYVYATWDKPIVVLCNQNSYSNAEIFSHAIKTLNRGKLVGVPTAGGVISAGSNNILDEGKLRIPFRGWFLSTTGEDLELNGASPEPENTIWPAPGELESGIDKQIERAVKVLSDEVKNNPTAPITPKYHNRK